MSLRKIFGEKVRRRRIELELSQEALALRARGAGRHAEWDQAYISRLEAGHVNASLDTIERVASALDCSVDILLSSCGTTARDRS